MKNSHNFILFFALFLALSACQGNSQKDGEHKEDDAAVHIPDPDKVARQVAFLSGEDCGQVAEGQFCIRGLSYIKLGDELTWSEMALEDAIVVDTVYEEITNIDTFAWNVKEVRSDRGKVILESDFNTYRFCGRIRIEDPGYKNLDGIGVGSTVADLKAKYDSFQVSPYPEMNVVEINLEGNNNLFIHVADPGNKLLDPNKDSWTIDDLPGDAKIVRVVIWDNTIGNPEA